jgi:NAD(P)-dependent dehydrogenase (short-subunit alcohol dehydrogenase family)
MTRWTTDDIPDQTGRTILVTGANSGLGLRSAEALAAKGARVLLGCRNEAKAKVARDAVAENATGPEPEVIKLDLSDLSSVAAAASAVDAAVPHLDVLMNNAGVMAIPKSKTADGFETQFGTNHLGHFALTAQLFPALRRAPAPRVVITSSTAHRAGKMRWDDLNWASGRYSKWLAYGQSKLANLLFMYELDQRTMAADVPLIAAAAHPGYAATHLQAVGPEAAGNRIMGSIMGGLNRIVAQSDADGALPQLYAATMPDVHGGEYFGPDGMFELRGGPQRAPKNGAAKDPDAARKLWEASEALTGVTFAIA